MSTMTSGETTIEEAERLAASAELVMEQALEHARQTMAGGRAIDDHQVQAERIAYAATELRAARELLGYALRAAQAGNADANVEEIAIAFTAEVAHRLRAQVEAAPDAWGVDEQTLHAELGSDSALAAVRGGLREDRLRAIGTRVIEARGSNRIWLEDDAAEMTRDHVRAFARSEVAPLAERIHRHDELVPDELIKKIAEMGLFAASIPEQYGGSEMGYLVMVVTTEELSAASLGAAGSLSTRPEILIKALLQGGTEAQREAWLPKIASGEVLVAIAVTEPDVGSDVAAVSCKAEQATLDGREGWLLNGNKAWSTFSGRADVLALLARTDPERGSGARGLSLFIVEKQPAYGHEYDQRQPGGGALSGKAIATPGYRGMHSYMVNFDNYFVPAQNLVGEEGGLNRGFYLQMAGFELGRLQTGGRACGVAQAALEQTAGYVSDRKQFGRPLADYQLTQYKLGRMATHIAAARQLTYAAARLMQGNERNSLDAAMAKLFACDVAVWVTQEGQLLHGGWGYAEETPISRYVVDAQVLPIFEGAKPILELKVIARALLAAQR
jgi:(2S)-methylsuccinyl-CoA dehydrogenase